MKLHFRLFVECSDSHEASVLAARLSEMLSKFDFSLAKPPKQYWKIPELFEFKYGLAVATQESYDRILACNSRDGWLHLGDNAEPCSVWNRTKGTKLLIESVTWAEVMLVP